MEWDTISYNKNMSDVFLGNFLDGVRCPTHPHYENSF